MPKPQYTATPTPPRPKGPAATAQAYVHPGRLVAARATGEFTTVVGSGVVVCVWDPVADVAGMAHFLLPEKGNAPPAPRFGDVAMRELVAEIERLGGARARFRACVMGGSAPPIAAESGHLGERNVHAAVNFLAANGISIQQKDVGGVGGRKVIFVPSAGSATVVRLNG